MMTRPRRDRDTEFEVPPSACRKDAPQRSVLIVSYLFPPIGGGGVQRAVKMARYLPEFGWNAHILTVDPRGDDPIQDPRLLDMLPGGTRIHRVSEPGIVKGLLSRARSSVRPADSPGGTASGPGPVRRAARRIMEFMRDRYFVPDEQVIWRQPAARAGRRLVDELSIDAVLSTSGPNTNHLVALDIKGSSGVPWVADFRDPWVGNMHHSSLPGSRQGREERLERQVMTAADGVTTVTRAFCERFRARYPERPSPTLIYNGFDPADYGDLPAAVDTDGAFTLVYAGILYPGRSPAPLMRAAHEALEAGDIPRDMIRLRFAGVFDYPGRDDHARLVRELDLGDVVEVLGHLPHRRALSLMAAADGLMIIGDTAPTAGEYIPGKIYEYMALGKPVVGTLMPGEARDILESTGASHLADPDDVSALRGHLVELYGRWRTNELCGARRAPPRIYHRDHQAGQLAWVLDRLTGADS